MFLMHELIQLVFWCPFPSLFQKYYILIQLFQWLCFKKYHFFKSKIFSIVLCRCACWFMRQGMVFLSWSCLTWSLTWPGITGHLSATTSSIDMSWPLRQGSWPLRMHRLEVSLSLLVIIIGSYLPRVATSVSLMFLLQALQLSLPVIARYPFTPGWRVSNLSCQKKLMLGWNWTLDSLIESQVNDRTTISQIIIFAKFKLYLIVSNLSCQKKLMLGWNRTLDSLIESQVNDRTTISQIIIFAKFKLYLIVLQL